MDRAAESSRMFMDAWDVMGRDEPGFASLRGGLFEVSWSGSACFFFNLASLARAPESVAELTTALDELKAWTTPRQQPWLLATCQELLGRMHPEADKILDAAGFGPQMVLTGMEAGALHPPARPLPAAARRSETQEGTGFIALRVNEAAYQMKFGEPGDFSMEHAGWWGAPERMVSLLEAGGQPVSSAAVFSANRVRYVALVATDPAAQRGGYAEAAMRDVLDRALTAGLSPRTYLHATEAGRPVYTRMGYTETAHHNVYALR